MYLPGLTLKTLICMNYTTYNNFIRTRYQWPFSKTSSALSLSRISTYQMWTVWGWLALSTMCVWVRSIGWPHFMLAVPGLGTSFSYIKSVLRECILNWEIDIRFGLDYRK